MKNDLQTEEELLKEIPILKILEGNIFVESAYKKSISEIILP